MLETWDVSVLAINYHGDPEVRRLYPYDIYPAIIGGDAFGFKRAGELQYKLKPHAVVIQNDPWNFPLYMKRLKDVPVIGAVAVDGLNCRGRDLNGLDLAIFWTDFGDREARAGGYLGPSAVIPLGVNLTTFRPLSRSDARASIGIPENLRDGFIIGNINRNQTRKRFDLTIRYFALWVKRYSISDAYLFIHTSETHDAGYDCGQLAAYYGVHDRLIMVNTDLISEQRLNQTYNCFDLQFTTTQGEGWGLPSLEGMAAGVPLLAPRWSALGEWAEPAAHLVECTSTCATPGEINAIGGVMDQEQAIAALQKIYDQASYRRELSARGLRLAANPLFRWENIGRQFNDAVLKAYHLATEEDAERCASTI